MLYLITKALISGVIQFCVSTQIADVAAVVGGVIGIIQRGCSEGSDSALSGWNRLRKQELRSIKVGTAMNFLFGIILGIILTVGTAFIADSFATASVTTDASLGKS
jgi:hypothetical protein